MVKITFKFIALAKMLVVLAFWALLFAAVRFLLLDVKILKRVLPKCCDKLSAIKSKEDSFAKELAVDFLSGMAGYLIFMPFFWGIIYLAKVLG